ncbi:MAG TPA: ATP-binding protein [Candidatus Limnocylindria bacterium]|nr:ATP-binding protein [Candidatus Limnocylindria bacterium]
MKRLDIVKALPLAVIVVDPRLRVTEVNPAARELLGLGDMVPETIGQLRAAVDVRDHATGALVTDETSTIERALQGEASTARSTLADARTHQRRVVDVATGPVRDPSGNIVAVAMALHDVTAIVDAERHREEFLSIVSHELKTPLTPLKALAQLIRGRIRRARASGQPPDLDTLEKNLATIERQVDRMNGLVNDLLEVSRAGRGTFELQPQEFDLAPAVREMAQRYIDATAEEGRHTISVEAPDTLAVVADQRRVEQVLWNVIGNAVKYSPRGGAVRVRLATDDGAALIEVHDQGIGVRKEDLARIGRSPFLRGAGKAESFAGMGIGLYLSRLVVEGHGGEIAIDSEGEDKGATVRVRLPLGVGA